MLFYKIKFKSFPKIKFACTTCTDKYKNIITYRKNMIEFGLSEGATEEERDGKAYILPPHNFKIMMPDISMKSRAVDDKPYFENSVAIEADFEFECYDTDDTQEIKKIIASAEKDELILPYVMPMNEMYTEFERLFKTLIIQYLKGTPQGNISAIALWLEIGARVSEEFKKSVSGEKTEIMGEYYTRKVQKYVEKNYAMPLKIGKIADMLKVTPNYLSAVFKKNAGVTLTEFITQTRLYHARRMAYDGGLTFEEIAKCVGICNEKYLNRLFIKYYGVSIKKCVATDREISLYHKKPWDEENLTRDIYETEED